jgi:hypothetical protein
MTAVEIRNLTGYSIEIGACSRTRSRHLGDGLTVRLDGACETVAKLLGI